MTKYLNDRNFTDFIHEKLAFKCIYEPLGWQKSNIDAVLLKQLDIHCGIDYVMETKEGRRITIQERFRDGSYEKYTDCTLRYRRDYNSYDDRKKSEYYKLKADFLVYGITNGSKFIEERKNVTDFLKFVVVDLNILRQQFLQNRIVIPQNNKQTSSFNISTGILTVGRMGNKDQSSDFIIFDIPQLNQLFGSEGIILHQRGFLTK